MMRPQLLLLCLASSVLALLPSCSTERYEIQMADGSSAVSVQRPSLQEKTGYYRYRTEGDRDAVVRAADVVGIHKQG